MSHQPNNSSKERSDVVRTFELVQKVGREPWESCRVEGGGSEREGRNAILWLEVNEGDGRSENIQSGSYAQAKLEGGSKLSITWIDMEELNGEEEMDVGKKKPQLLARRSPSFWQEEAPAFGKKKPSFWQEEGDYHATAPNPPHRIHYTEASVPGSRESGWNVHHVTTRDSVEYYQHRQ